MHTTVIIQNLKCKGCKNTVNKYLEKIEGISNIKIDVETNHVSFNYKTDNAIENVRIELSELGYPIIGDPNTIASKVKSFVSCAVGKIN